MNSFLHSKPAFGQPCNGCGYCCFVQSCGLAQEFLGDTSIGPCSALEIVDGRSTCGLVRNPLGYLYRVAHPNASDLDLANVPNIEDGQQITKDITTALGVGRGCDSADDDESATWPHADASL